MSKIGNYNLGMEEHGTFSAYSSDGKSEVTLDGPVNPDRLVYADSFENEKEIPDYKSGGSIAFVEPEEIEVILELSKALKAGRNKRVLELLYERLK